MATKIVRFHHHRCHRHHHRHRHHHHHHVAAIIDAVIRRRGRCLLSSSLSLYFICLTAAKSFSTGCTTRGELSLTRTTTMEVHVRATGSCRASRLPSPLAITRSWLRATAPARGRISSTCSAEQRPPPFRPVVFLRLHRRLLRERARSTQTVPVLPMDLAIVRVNYSFSTARLFIDNAVHTHILFPSPTPYSTHPPCSYSLNSLVCFFV